ncbi:hypothetical protein D187_001743 [Cystobacter fuscus DSM 2262]|uniref:MrfA-like Zn-binding domain-containing protein n=1 Tax=Cystobacter fuscus (strain ATCC 25194 / DSM 2262 / NBRC 100088 / M29) TaxID=1242864 RepID=S9QH27_CYSF2|nr:DUF1998 domain-containing protein [Cystobacter fuscus]EPX60589.1 hypothetical protein D187_001743 [Cystobacter fuscus DSM 2262]
MANNELGKLRRSTVVSTFGPGAVVDFRADGAAISGVVSGIEEWDNSFKPPGVTNPQSVHEPRLERKLGVRGFRLPPVIDENRRDANGNLSPDTRRLVAVRFPDWLLCPNCDRIAPSRKWGEEPGRPTRHCVQCTRKAPGGHKVFAVPVRFVMACPRGHLDDFPWHWWVGHTPDCANKGFLMLKAERPGLAGLFVRCPDCGAGKSLDGIFTEATWKDRMKCKGKRPWLSGPDEDCDSDKPVRAMQRGASNLYFPAIESALSIPDWSDGLQEALGVYWQTLVDTPAEDRPMFVKLLARGDLKAVLQELKLSPEELSAEIDRRLQALEGPDILDLRGGEYRQFTLAGGYADPSDKEFETRSVAVPIPLKPYFSRIVRVVRLREVRALYGFTRINPPGDGGEELSPIWRTKPDWLPAIDVRGEGIFLEFSPERLDAWESEGVRKRAARINAAWREEWLARYGEEGGEPRTITARFLLVHTFAHALMRQLTLDCGYSSASLKERLYVRDGEGAMAGLLVYTATSDADGTLGGLQRQGEPERIARTIPAAIQAMEWCSSDPLCIEGVMGGADGLSLAACHACVLAPETACEEFNRFLDRAMLVGAPGHSESGYFTPMLQDP